MADERDEGQHPVLTRARPSDGKARRLLRLFMQFYALSSKEISRHLHISQRQAERYIERLYARKFIYQRYMHEQRIYYSFDRRKQP